jgi:hypothetical protein
MINRFFAGQYSHLCRRPSRAWPQSHGQVDFRRPSVGLRTVAYVGLAHVAWRPVVMVETNHTRYYRELLAVPPLIGIVLAEGIETPSCIKIIAEMCTLCSQAGALRYLAYRRGGGQSHSACSRVRRNQHPRSQFDRRFVP